MLTDRLSELKQKALTTDQASVELRELERDAEASRGVYQTFLVRSREVGQQSAIDSTNARVISEATPPRNKSWPPRILLALIAAMAGLGIGTGVGLMREHFDDRVHTPEQLRNLFGVRVAAILPALDKSEEPLAELPGGAEAGPPANGKSPSFATAVMRLHDTLFAGAFAVGGRSILVSSTAPGEGKTTLASSLALAAVSRGKRVLLIDGDLVSGTLTKQLGAEQRFGLCDLLDGETALRSVLLVDEHKQLFFMPIGHLAAAPNVYSKPQLLVRKIAEAAKGFDLTVIDGCSVLGNASVRGLAEAADDILFVVRAASAPRQDIRAAFDGSCFNAGKIRWTVFSTAEAIA